jgi:AcrR family transcriptional regulator
MPEPKLMKIGELEKLSGYPRHTIHQYVRRGLLHEPIKTGKTMAYYDQSHLERLQAIREVKGEQRLPLSYVQDVLAQREAVARKSGKGKGLEKDGKNASDAVEKSKRRIKEVALDVFRERGYYQTRVQDITAAAGVSTGTFYLNYRDKRELFLDAVDDLISKVMPSFEEEIMNDSNVMRRVITRFQSFIYGYEFYSEIGYVLMGIAASREPWARDRVVVILNKLMEPLMNDIRAGIKKWVVRDVDPELLTRALMGMMEFLAFRLTLDDKYTYEQVTSFIIDLVMKGIARD